MAFDPATDDNADGPDNQPPMTSGAESTGGFESPPPGDEQHGPPSAAAAPAQPEGGGSAGRASDWEPADPSNPETDEPNAESPLEDGAAIDFAPDPTSRPPDHAAEYDNGDADYDPSNPPSVESYINASDDSASVRRCTVRPLAWQFKHKVQQVFYPSAAVERVIADFKDGQRVFTIYGDRHTGRFFTAVGLAQRLTAISTGEVYSADLGRPRFEVLLQDLASYQKEGELLRGSVCIVPKAFCSQLGDNQLSRDELDYVREELFDLDLRLILIADLPSAGGQFPSLNCVTLSSELPPAEVRTALATTLQSHLDYFHRNPSAGFTISNRMRSSVEQADEFILGRLSSCVQVNELLSRVSQVDLDTTTGTSGAEPDAESAEVPPWLADTVERIASPIEHQDRAWFSSLSANERLYALLVSLFGELPLESIHELYSAVTSALKKEGLTVVDYRESGLHDLLRSIHVVEEDGRGTLRFETLWHEQEVERQVANYRDLLWTAMSSVHDWIVGVPHRDTETLLSSLGKAIGRLGAHHWSHLEGLLSHLSDHDLLSVALIPSWAVEVSIGRSQRPKALKLLRQWADAPSPRQRRSAARAIAVVHRRLAKAGDPVLIADGPPLSREDRQASLVELENCLAKIAESFNAIDANWFASELTRVNDARRREGYPRVRPRTAHQLLTQEVWLAVVFAVEEMFANTPERVVAMLSQWLERGEADAVPQPAPNHSKDVALEEDPDDRDGANELAETRRRFGHALCGILLKKRESVSALPADEFDALLALAGLALSHAGGEISFDIERYVDDNSQDDANSSVLGKLQAWVTEAPNRRDEIQRTLLAAVSNARVDQRRKLEWVLHRDWSMSRVPEVESMADAVLQRAHILDGAPFDLSPAHHGVLLLETPTDNRYASLKFSYELYKQLGFLVGIQVGALGESRWFCQSWRQDRGDGFRALESKALLAMPLLERITADDHVHFVMIVSWVARAVRPIAGDTTPGNKKASDEAADWDSPVHDLSDVRDHPKFAGDPLDRFLCIRDMGHLSDPRQESATDAPLDESHRLQWFDYNLGSRRTLVRLTRLVSDRLARALACRTADQWWAVLAPHVTTSSFPDTDGAPTPPVVRRLIESLASEMDSVASASDPVKLIACLYQWLIAADPAEAADHTLAWLREEEGALRRSLSKAFYMMLTRAVTCFDYESPEYAPQAIERALKLLPMGVELASLGLKYETIVYLRTVGRLCRYAAWRRCLTEPANMSLLYRLMEQAPITWQDAMQEELWKWRNNAPQGREASSKKCASSPILGATPALAPLDVPTQPVEPTSPRMPSLRPRTQSPEKPDLAIEPSGSPGQETGAAEQASDEMTAADEIHHLGLALALHLALGPAVGLPALSEGEQYLVIIVDGGEPARPNSQRRARERLRSIGSLVFAQCYEACTGQGIVPVLYRVGQSKPAFIKPCGKRRLMPLDVTRLPNCVMPILDEFSRGQVLAPVLITSSEPTDWQDVEDLYPAFGMVYTDAPDQSWVASWRSLEGHHHDVDRVAEAIVGQIKSFVLDDPYETDDNRHATNPQPNRQAGADTNAVESAE
ncbi:MAG: hypothetical protein AAGJ46_12750 [Planctomycetota bacterium]